MNKTLILCCGIPRSGKSTWAHEQIIQNNIPVVTPDQIRLAIHGKAVDQKYEDQVWSTAHIMVNYFFIQGYDHVILDACSVTNKRRKEWLSNNYKIKLKVFNTPKEVCIQRAIDTNQEYLFPVIERMSKNWEEPNPDLWQIIGVNCEL